MIIYTYSGQKIDLTNPDFSRIVLDDIAIPLSRIPRFNGHTNYSWTVAEHSMLVAELCSFDKDCQKLALVHDAHEAFIGDITRPVKQVLGKKFKDFENKIQFALLKRLGIEDYLDKTMKTVKHYDDMALAMEGNELMVNNSWVPTELSHVNSKFVRLNYTEEEERFEYIKYTEMFHKLFGKGVL